MSAALEINATPRKFHIQIVKHDPSIVVSWLLTNASTGTAPASAFASLMTSTPPSNHSPHGKISPSAHGLPSSWHKRLDFPSRNSFIAKPSKTGNWRKQPLQTPHRQKEAAALVRRLLESISAQISGLATSIWPFGLQFCKGTTFANATTVPSTDMSIAKVNHLSPRRALGVSTDFRGGVAA